MDKEATVYIIDQGKSMGKKHSGRNEDDLSFSLRYVWDKITTTIQAERKTFCLGIVGVRTDRTAHGVAVNDESYHNISIHQNIKGPYLLADLREAQEKIKVSNTDRGDVISAVVIAYTMIDKFAPSRLKYKRKIVLVTNARGHIDGDDLDQIASKLNEANIELMVLGVDFDDAEYGFKEEDKDPKKADNEKVLQSLCDKCETKTFGTIAEAVEELNVPRLKVSRPYSTYKGPLWLGNPDLEENTAMVIQVERYFKTKKATAPSASTFVKAEVSSNETNDLDGDTNMGGVSADGLAAVKSNTTYSVVDPTAEGQKRELKRDELAKGYMYGRTAVPISASEEDVTKLDTNKEFTILGFVPSENYPKYFNMEMCCVTVATQLPGSTRDKMALSSFVHGLAENNSYAVARMVEKDKKNPVLLLLAPLIEVEFEALIDIVLPFQEDLRLYRFPALDHVLTVFGTVLTKHRHLPTDELTEAMSAYVDSMDLSIAGVDEEGNPAEYLTIEDNFKPDLHRISQGIRFRAAYPDQPIPPIPDILVKYRNPPEELVAASKQYLDKLIEAADVKAVPEKVKGAAGKGQAAVVPKSGLDVTALLTRKSKITPENAIPEFKQYLTSTEEIDVGIEKAVKQFTPIILDMITNPLPQYERVLEHLKVLKKEMISFGRPELYNLFMIELKRDVLEGKLGGERKDLWFKIIRKSEGLGLVVDEEGGEVSEEVARRCMTMTMGDVAEGGLPVRSVFG